jgi:hypothetical protein
MRALAEQDERDRRQTEAALLADLGHPPSITEAIAIETISAQLIRSRRMRRARRQREAEMAERLIMRGLGRLGIRQGSAKPAETPLEYARRKYGRSNAESATEAPSNEGGDR